MRFRSQLRLPTRTPLQIFGLTPRAVMANGHEFIKKGVSLYLREETQVSIIGFHQKLLRFLREAKHVVTESRCRRNLGLRREGGLLQGQDRAIFLEDLLTRFEMAEVSHFFVLPNEAITDPMRIEGYTLGDDPTSLRC